MEKDIEYFNSVMAQAIAEHIHKKRDRIILYLYYIDGRSYGGDASYGGEAYARGRRNAHRDSMGRYSREEGYSRGTWDMVDQIEDLIREAPDEQTRQELQRIAGKMRNG